MSALSAQEQANLLKAEGNQLLSAARYSAAADKYTEALALYESPIFYSNRAQAYIKMESHGLAIADANASIKLDPKYVKAYYRRGSANFALGKPKLALKDFKAVCNIVKNDPDATKKMALCDKVIKAEMFSSAIECNYDNAVAPVADYTSIEVPETYKGPRLDDSGVLTSEFVVQVMEWFKEQKSLHKRYVLQIMSQYQTMVSDMPTLLYIQLPSLVPGAAASSADLANDTRRHITVCGDTHGQFYDLCNIFHIGGLPSVTNPYLFNGDYVDRGSFSFENVFTLMCWKLVHPNCMYMLRGNHETKNMNKIYGFEGEVLHKYDKVVMGMFTHIFNNLPLSAVIQNTVFVTHGGLSTTKDGNVTLAEIAAITRNREPNDSGLMSDLMWSDPQPELGRSPSKRGIGFSFGPDITANFLRTNNLSLVVRSHEVKDEGYVVEHDGKCITIFSAPNYCDQMKNKGAFIRFYEDMEPNFTQYSEVPHPHVPPMMYSSGLMSQFGL